MTAQAFPKLALRPLLPEDVPLLAEIFRASIEELTAEDFEKGYNHPAMGRQSLAVALALYAWHSRHHTAHITSLRTRQGW